MVSGRFFAGKVKKYDAPGFLHLVKRVGGHFLFVVRRSRLRTTNLFDFRRRAISLSLFSAGTTMAKGGGRRWAK
jgi:hypothetical protein